MAKELKAIDGLIQIPRATTARAQSTSGVLDLFPGSRDRQQDTTPEELVAIMDEANVEKGVLSMGTDADKNWIMRAMQKYPGKFVFGTIVNPAANGVMNEVRRVKNLIDECGLQLIRVRPFDFGAPCTDSRLFPLYALAIEHNLKIHTNIGYPAPAGLARNQSPLYVDELCYLLPELKIIQIHLGHPWVEEAIHNVIKYPNCYLQTCAYRPKYFTPEVVQHINTRAQDKVIWASEYPMIPFKTSLGDVKELPLRDHVRPKYLRENILRLFKFD